MAYVLPNSSVMYHRTVPTLVADVVLLYPSMLAFVGRGGYRKSLRSLVILALQQLSTSKTLESVSYVCRRRVRLGMSCAVA